VLDNRQGFLDINKFDYVELMSRCGSRNFSREVRSGTSGRRRQWGLGANQPPGV